jgi:hypothetical protein
VLSYPVAGSYFDTLGLSVVDGRPFDDREAFANAPVAVVDQRAARTLWPGESALGQAIVDTGGTLRTVVGVVASVATSIVNPEQGTGTSFTPFDAERNALLMARPTATSGGLEALRRLVLDIEPTSYVETSPFRPIEQSQAQPRFLARLLSMLGLLVIALTIVGVFGVVHHEDARRLREMGIRVLLGASPTRLQWQVLAAVLIPATVGVTVGVASSWPYMGTLQALLFGVEPHSPVTLLATGLFVLLLVTGGSWLPAWQASRADAVQVLRAE